MIHWTKESLAIIHTVGLDDETLVEVSLWACFKHGGTIVVPVLEVVSSDPNDLRMQLMVSVANRFWQAKD